MNKIGFVCVIACSLCVGGYKLLHTHTHNPFHSLFTD